MSQPKASWVVRGLHALTGMLYHHPRWFFLPQVVLFGVCIWYTVAKLEFDTNRDNLVSSQQSHHHAYLDFKKEFPSQDDMVVVIQSEDQEKNRQFVERLGPRLEAETNLFADVFYKGDLKMMGNKALLFVPDNDLKELKQTLHDYRPFLLHFAKATNLNSLFELVNQQIATAKKEENAENEAMMKALPALDRIITQATDALRRRGEPVSPGLNALFGGGPEAERAQYITFAEGRVYLVTAKPKNEDISGDAARRLNELVAEVQPSVPGVNVGITGEKILELDEMAQSQEDTTLAAIVALLLSALIFIFGYNETRRPIMATICLLVGVAYTLAFATLAVGHLNILTITFVPILIGLAIDFGVHLISRYEEELRKGNDPLGAMRLAIEWTGQGILTGALTTAGAFLAMALTQFKGVQEMGIICGGGLVVSLVPMMTMLPVMLFRGKQKVADGAARRREDERRARLEQLWLARPWTTVAVTVVLTGIAASQFHRVTFDYNLLHMQSQGLPAVETEQMLINSAGKSVLYCAVVVSNLDQAAKLEQAITNLSSVTNIESMATFLRGDQREQLKLIGEIKQELEGINFAPADTRPVDCDALRLTLYSLRGYLGAIIDYMQGLPEAKEAKEKEIIRQLSAMRDSIQDLRKAMNEQEAKAAAKLGTYQRAFFRDIHETFAALRTQDNREKLRVQDLPEALRNRFVGVTGKYLLMVYPKKDVWERQPQEEFVHQLESVVPEVTGTPVQLYAYTTELKESYIDAAKYSLAAIVVLVLLHFRSLLGVILALLPVAIGTAWMCGMMGWCGVMFNPANIMTLPLVIGIGVTNGIHVLNRFAEERETSIFGRSTGKALLVSGLTAVAGFGSLMLGKHQGIVSLGFVMSIGITTCMVAGVTFLPAVMTLLQRAGFKIIKPSGGTAPRQPVS